MKNISDIDSKMKKILNGLLFSDSESKDFIIANEILSCVLNKIKRNDNGSIDSSLQNIIELIKPNKNNKDEKLIEDNSDSQAYFVPNFIENLLQVKMSDSNLNNLAKNLEISAKTTILDCF